MSTQSLIFGRLRMRATRATVRLGSRIALNRGQITEEQRTALLAIRGDADVADYIRDRANAENVDKGQRDWNGFLEALANFILAILPEIIKLFGMAGVSLPVTEAPTE